jgi:hypothetical protein
VERLALNRGGYHGEKIDFPRIESAILETAGERGWNIDVRSSEPVARSLHFLSRGEGTGRRLYVSAGMHGDEPASLLAILRLLRENLWPSDVPISLAPCLNPSGCLAGTRYNADGIDINRDYRHFRTSEARAHVGWLQGKAPFDLSLCLHEDWESHGFYLYELNPGNRPSLAASMIAAVRTVCPIDNSPIIDGREAHSPGLIRPLIDPLGRPEWPEALWLLANGSCQGYTLEAPSDWPMSVRVEALVAGVRAGLEAWGRL